MSLGAGHTPWSDVILLILFVLHLSYITQKALCLPRFHLVKNLVKLACGIVPVFKHHSRNPE